MASKLTLLAAIALLAGLAVTPSAVAIGVGERQQVATSPARAAQAPESPIAPTAACPGQDRLDAPAQVQLQAMRCMTDFARERAGLPPLAEAEQLDSSAYGKSSDVLQCDDFSHFACGRQFTYWIEESGYLAAQCWRVGENLAWGTGEEGTVRSIFRAWMRSPGHRQNIFGEFSQLGIGLQVGQLSDQDGVRVWTQHFGSHCETAGSQA